MPRAGGSVKMFQNVTFRYKRLIAYMGSAIPADPAILTGIRSCTITPFFSTTLPKNPGHRARLGISHALAFSRRKTGVSGGALPFFANQVGVFRERVPRLLFFTLRRVAQWIEQQIENLRGIGSTPISSTRHRFRVTTRQPRTETPKLFLGGGEHLDPSGTDSVWRPGLRAER